MSKNPKTNVKVGCFWVMQRKARILVLIMSGAKIAILLAESSTSYDTGKLGEKWTDFEVKHGNSARMVGIGVSARDGTLHEG